MNDDIERLGPLLRGNSDFQVMNSREIERFAYVQSPKHVFVACSDSRVSPELITKAGIGEIFGVRTMGGYLGKESIGSIEFAVSGFNIENLVVVGHTKCGAVSIAQRMLNGSIDMDEQRALRGESFCDTVSSIGLNISKNPENLSNLNSAVMDNARAQAMVLINNPVVANAMTKGMRLYVMMYNIERGSLELAERWHSQDKERETIAAAKHQRSKSTG